MAISIIREFLDSVTRISEKFINKVESGKAQSKETYADMKYLRDKAQSLRDMIE